eukprot:1933226-Rhodomonas_salina.1
MPRPGPDRHGVACFHHDPSRGRTLSLFQESRTKVAEFKAANFQPQPERDWGQFSNQSHERRPRPTFSYAYQVRAKYFNGKVLLNRNTNSYLCGVYYY